MNTLCGQHAVLLYVTAGGMYSYHCGSNGFSEIHRSKFGIQSFQKAAECDDVRTFSCFIVRLLGW